MSEILTNMSEIFGNVVRVNQNLTHYYEGARLFLRKISPITVGVICKLQDYAILLSRNRSNVALGFHDAAEEMKRMEQSG